MPLKTGNNDYNIQIVGFKFDVDDFGELMRRINEIKTDVTDMECTIQLLNADGVAGEEHVMHATVHALKAFERGENFAKDLGLEIAVRSSAQRQISKALNILGIKKGGMNICMVAVGCQDAVMDHLGILLGKRDDDILKPDKHLLKNIYKISEEEVRTAGNISRAMMERTSLLALEN